MRRQFVVFPSSVLVFYIFVTGALTANIQAQPGLWQPSQAPSAASVAPQAISSAPPPSISSSTPVNGDPCGPAVQDNPNYPNTCNLVPALVDSPAPYGINCTKENGVLPTQWTAVNWANVEVSIHNMCIKMQDSRTMTGRWVWSKLAPQAALGFFLPPYPGAAIRPSMQRCLQIFTAMNNTCATTVTPTNFASINLRSLPGSNPSYYTGEAVRQGNYLGYLGEALNVGYTAYALTYQVNGGSR